MKQYDKVDMFAWIPSRVESLKIIEVTFSRNCMWIALNEKQTEIQI